MHDQSYIRELADKWINNTITEDEKIIFNEWYKSFNYTELEILDDISFDEVVLREKIRASIKQDIPEFNQNPKIYNIRKLATMAAAVLMVLGLSLFFIPKLDKSKSIQGVSASVQVQPGKNTATLTLADGRKILLSSSTNGKLAMQGSTEIIKSADGQIQYEVNADGSQNSNINQFNTLSTARGEQFQVVLPDGTKVWLNAASTLRFPASFAAQKQRKVELSGEAYFEVMPDKKHAFIVTTDKQEVEVLGTHFNISSYEDDEVAKTTLIEGSVRVSLAGMYHQKSNGYNSVVLKPGQQSAAQNTISVSTVDPEAAVAWKKGYFMFNDEYLESIMKKISRWYNVDIVYTGNIKANKFQGKVSRFDDVSEVLKVLELTESVHFKVKERRIIVMP